MLQQHLSKIRIISFIGLLVFANSLISNPTEIKEIFAPSHLGKIKLLHDEDGFHVSQNGIRHEVKKVWMDPVLRNITSSTLKKFLASGYIQINKMSNDEFTLNAKGRILGGGPILATIVYGATKALGYGTAAAAIGGITVATGGIAGPIIGGAVSVATSAVAASTGATIVAGAIAGAGGTATAAMATTSVVAAAGGVAGAVTFIEATALFFSAAALALPTP